ncbi:Inorganic pyrophosphatase 2 [Spatholobus suberectus]|nr:Inorganic pyrophosphatase 2 [Spatholobus suberectus]
MDRMMMELHSHGKTIDDTAQVLQRIPIHPRIIPAIKAAHALGCDLRIVSDANAFFIETILKHLGIRECFSEINTNPGCVNEEGRLRILPYHDFNKSPHGCCLCPPNMCKGLIIERIQNSVSEAENKRYIYLGDGSGDYCPSLRLKDRDFVMPRKNFPVWDLICKDPSLIKAEIHEWSDGEEFEQVLMQLINQISLEESAQIISADCKLHNLSLLMRPFPQCDSDNWVLDEFGLTEKFYQLLPSMPWNPLMVFFNFLSFSCFRYNVFLAYFFPDREIIFVCPKILQDKMMNELHSQGKTIEDIVQVLNRTPIHPRIVTAIEAAYSLGCELKIVSDANIFFIETILKHHGVWNCFSEVTANPSYGLVIERIQNSLDAAGKKKFIYLGDGSGDFCPSLKLKDRDYLMPRMNFPLCDLVSKSSDLIKAEVHAWRDGEELYDVLLHFINKAIGEGNSIISSSTPTISVDCKLGSISIGAHKPFPKALPVPQ